MDATFAALYRRKKIYTECARAVLTDNYAYYSGVTDAECTARLYEEICTAMQHTDTVYLYDTIGCCSNSVLRKISESYSRYRTVFVIEDDMCAGSILGIFVPEKKIYIFSVRELCAAFPFYYNLNSCYMASDRRKYTNFQYTELANYFISCRRSIDKTRSVMI